MSLLFGMLAVVVSFAMALTNGELYDDCWIFLLVVITVGVLYGWFFWSINRKLMK